MRTIPILSTLALAGALQAASWTALPQLPRGSSGTVSGDGNAVVYTNFVGGTSVRSPSSSTSPWTLHWADALTKSVVARKGLVAYLVDDGVFYKTPGDTVLRKAVFTNTVGKLSLIDHDGRRILAIRSGWSHVPTLHLSVDSVVTDPVLSAGVSSGAAHYWRTLPLPGGLKKNIKPLGWIEGRLVVLSASKTYLSRDTGATWTDSSAPRMSVCDISGDTIVGRNYSPSRLYVSTDAGASWDSSALGAPDDIVFRNGKLYGLFMQNSDSTYDLASSANLGKTWNTLLEEVNKSTELVAWDGSSLFVSKREALLRSPDEGRSWVNADSGMGETMVSKIRGFGDQLLVLQKLKPHDSYEIPRHRLWALADGSWSLVRDSVMDFEVMETDTGRAVFALVGGVARWDAPPSAAKLALERSYNLKSWQVLPGIEPLSVVLGMSKRGLMVGQTNNVAIWTRDSRILLDAAWKINYGTQYLVKRGFLLEQDGNLAWSSYGGMEYRQDTVVTYYSKNVKTYATLGSRHGYRILDTTSSWLTDFKEITSPYGLLNPTVASGAAAMRDSIATWNGSDTIALMRPEGERRVLGPQGRGVTLVDWVSIAALGANTTMLDSTFVVADLHGRLWKLDKSGTVGIGATSPRVAAPLAFRRGSLALELSRPAHVRIERYDGRGRSLGVVVDGVFEPGRHAILIDPVGGVTFAVPVLDGIRQEPVRILPSGM